MPPYTSPIFRLRLSALGEDLNTWGDPNLNNALKLIEEAVASTLALTITTDRTLSADNYISNEYRRHTLVLNGTPAADFTITVPAVSFPYRFVNKTGKVATIRTAPGAVAATVRVGRTTTVLCDGTDCTALDPTLDQIKTATGDVAMGGFKFTGNANGSASTDLVTVGQSTALFAPFTSAAAASAQLASDWASKTPATVDGTEYSAKLWATSTAVLTGGNKGAKGFALDAGTSAALAQSWATSTTVVSGGFKGAFGYAQDAATSATAAAASYDSFDDRYLGPKASDPTLDNDGVALLIGALYFNTTAGEMRAYNGAAWVAAYVTAGSFVAGPATATADAIALFNGTGGKTIKDSGFLFGTAAELRSNASNRLSLNTTLWSAHNFAPLTDAATIAVDFATGINFRVTLAGNRTLGAPTNLKDGQSGIIRIKQDATGSRTLAFNAAWKFPGAAVPTLSTAANTVDRFSYVVTFDGASTIVECTGLEKGIA